MTLSCAAGLLRRGTQVAVGLVVTEMLVAAHLLPLAEGEYVDVIEWVYPSSPDLAVCRTAGQAIGFYPNGVLRSEEDIFAEFRQAEDIALTQEIEQREEKARAEEVAIDAALREKIKQKAEDDRIARAAEAERRKREVCPP